MGKDLPSAVKQDIIATIADFRDIFAFSTEEMPGIPTSVMCHKLDIRLGYKPEKQSCDIKGKSE